MKLEKEMTMKGYVFGKPWPYLFLHYYNQNCLQPLWSLFRHYVSSLVPQRH